MSSSVKCKNCGTVNWAAAEECIRCKTILSDISSAPAELPSAVVEILALTPQPRPMFSRYLFGGVVVVLLLAAALYAYSETRGYDNENKTSLLARLYWGKRPPTGEFLIKGLEDRVRCFREYKKVYPVVRTAPTLKGPCLRGEIPFGFYSKMKELGIKTCKEVEASMTSPGEESATVEIVKTELIEAHFDKFPPIESNGAKNGHPERSATLFFKATAKMDYFVNKKSGNDYVKNQGRETVSDIVVLLLYWNEQTFNWMPFEDCKNKES